MPWGVTSGSDRQLSFRPAGPEEFYGMSGSRSVGLDPCRLDDGPPLLNLSLLHRGNRFGRLLLTRGNFASKVNKLLNDTRLGQGACDGTVELANDILRRAF